MVTELRKTGIDVLGDASWGTHFCQFYQTREDMLDILVPYFKAGLENNEFCMWVTSAPLDKDEATKALRGAVPDLDEYLSTGQIEILPHTEWYLKDGAFDAQRVLNGWVDKLNGALAAGFEGLRLTGNTHWLEEADWDSFGDYEQQINNVIGDHRMLAMCSYSLDKCGAAEILEVVGTHQFALIRRAGKWAIVESSERKQAQDRLGKEMTAITTVVDDMLRGEMDDAQTEAQVLDACLTATDSLYGMIGKINEHGKYDTTTYNSRTMQDCAFPEALAWDMSTGMPIRGIWGSAMLHGEPLICNDLPAHPDRVGYPKGHVEIECFLGVPLKRDGQTTGMVAVANKPGGYTKEDRDTLIRLASVISISSQHRQALIATKQASQALSEANTDLESEVGERKQAEEALKKSSTELQKTVNLMAGREVRMAELKEAIRKLREQLDSAGLKPVADDPLKEKGKGKS